MYKETTTITNFTRNGLSGPKQIVQSESVNHTTLEMIIQNTAICFSYSKMIKRDRHNVGTRKSIIKISILVSIELPTTCTNLHNYVGKCKMSKIRRKQKRYITFHHQGRHTHV